jgi:hypothetical protein
VIADGTATDDPRHVLTAIIVPAMLCSSVTVTFDDDGADLTAPLAGYTIELFDDLTLFFGLDRRHGRDVAGKFAVDRWSETPTNEQHR